MLAGVTPEIKAGIATLCTGKLTVDLLLPHTLDLSWPLLPGPLPPCPSLLPASDPSTAVLSQVPWFFFESLIIWNSFSPGSRTLKAVTQYYVSQGGP